MLSRSVLRATKVAAPAARAAWPKAARASFASSTKLRTPPEVIAEKEVPNSSYAGGEVQRSTLIVGDNGSGKVTPLTQSTFKTLPQTMQKLSLYGKTVVVTG